MPNRSFNDFMADPTLALTPVATYNLPEPFFSPPTARVILPPQSIIDVRNNPALAFLPDWQKLWNRDSRTLTSI